MLALAEHPRDQKTAQIISVLGVDLVELDLAQQVLEYISNIRGKTHRYTLVSGIQ